MVLVLISNQRSRPMSSVIEATTATMIAGMAATRENMVTMRTCRREAALPCRRAIEMRWISRAISAISRATNPALTAISVSVVVLSGVIGVAPTRMANETAAPISAPTIATIPVNTSRRRPSACAGSL